MKRPANPFQGGLFDGETFDRDLDGRRLSGQGLRVYKLLRQAGYSKWLTLRDISDRTGDPEASVSARLRDLRKPDKGSYTVQARRKAGHSGLWEYRLETRHAKKTQDD